MEHFFRSIVMSVFSVECPMALPAKARAITNVKSHLRVVVPREDVMRCQSSAPIFTFAACVVGQAKNIISPFLVLRPISLSLPKSGLATLIIPMFFAAINVGKLVLAFFRTRARFSIRLVEHFLSAHFAYKRNASNTIVNRLFTEMGQSICFFVFLGTLQANIPYSGLTFSEMTWPKTRNLVFFKPISDSFSMHPVGFRQFFGAYFLNKIEIFEFFFRWFHTGNYTNNTKVSQSVCTATNTWKRVAIASW